MLDAYKLHVAIKVTEELLYDNAFHLENYIIDQFGKALANAEEDAFLNGDGTGKPLGIFAANGSAQKNVVTAKASMTAPGSSIPSRQTSASIRASRIPSLTTPLTS